MSTKDEQMARAEADRLEAEIAELRAEIARLRSTITAARQSMASLMVVLGAHLRDARG